jgi:hypothetical protein
MGIMIDRGQKTEFNEKEIPHVNKGRVGTGSKRERRGMIPRLSLSSAMLIS